jgi:hypothetical protein
MLLINLQMFEYVCGGSIMAFTSKRLMFDVNALYVALEYRQAPFVDHQAQKKQDHSVLTT